MAHEIDQTVFAEGQAIFAKEPAWHGLGKVKPYTFQSSVAIEEVGLGFNVTKRPLYVPTFTAADGVEYAENPTKEGDTPLRRIRGYAATVREDSGAVLGVVGSDFVPLQNKEMFSVLDQAVEASGQPVMYESAGSLRGGRHVWALARLPEVITVESREGADKLYQYFLALNGHDGTRGASFFPTTVRVVCANTAAAAEYEAERTRQVRWNHTANITDKIPAMVGEIKGCISDLQNWGELAQVLAKKQVETEAEVETLGKIINATLQDVITGDSDRSKARKLAAYQQILGYFAGLDQAYNPGEEPTLWRAYNAISYWIEHQSRKSKTQENRFEYLLLGVGAAMKSNVLRQLAKMAPRPTFSKP